jgi:ABC-2 type transport system permease protein
VPTSIFRELALVQTREMFRDLKTLFLTVLYPFVILAIFMFVGSVTPKSPGGPNIQALSIAMTLFLSVGSFGFFGLAVPLVAMRERGTLRLLSTTPLRRATLLASQVPGRAVVAAGQIVVIIGIGLAIGAVTFANIPMLRAACLLGLVLFASLGYLIGGRAPSSESTSTVTAIGLVVLMFASGLVFPIDSLPAGVSDVARFLPTTYIGDMLRHVTLGTPAQYAPLLGVGVVLAYSVVFAVIALRTFRWDAGERA